MLKEGAEMKYMKINGNDLIENRCLSSGIEFVIILQKRFVFMQTFCRLVVEGFSLKAVSQCLCKRCVI